MRRVLTAMLRCACEAMSLSSIEQAFQIAFLHVHAEEVGVAFSQGESWLGFDAAEFVAWFQNEVVEAVDEVGVVFQFAQHGDDD